MPEYKYNEDQLIEEFKKYVDSTYSQHYVGKNNVQSLDLIFSSENGRGFTIGNVLKYAARYGKKGGRNRDDLMKIIHYSLLALFVHDEEVGRITSSTPLKGFPVTSGLQVTSGQAITTGVEMAPDLTPISAGSAA